jgi:hypothetical protein
MAIRNVHIKTLMFFLSRINLEAEYVDLGYNPQHGLIIIPSANPPKPTNNVAPPEADDNKITEIKLDDPNTKLDDLLG